MVFNVSRKDAEKLAKELFTFTGQKVKYQPESQEGKPVGRPQYFSIQEEVEHAITTLSTQKVGECHIRIKGPNDNGEPYQAKVPLVDPPPRDPAKEEAFRQASAAIYYTPSAQIEIERKERLGRFIKPPKQFSIEE
jgi:hypothetical protein